MWYSIVMTQISKPADLRIAVFQLNMTADIKKNKEQIESLIFSLEASNSECWVFPECALFRPSSTSDFKAFEITETIIPWFQSLAKTYKKWVLVGSFFHQKNEGQVCNTSVLVSPEGILCEQYDKIHLFDVQVNRLSFCESDHFSAGTTPSMACINGYKCGLSICFDLRFPELYRHYADKGCDILFVPSSFTKTTGKRHWHILCQARAIENQCYVVAPNQCGIGANNAETYGHSLIVGPDGTIIAEAVKDRPCCISATLSQSKINHTRTVFPLLKARRL